MRKIVVFVILAYSFLGCQSDNISYQVAQLVRVSPESQGVSSKNVMDYLDSLMHFPHTEIHSVLILRYGKVIAETYPNPYKPIYGHPLFSCSKTFVAAAIGVAISENLIKKDDKVLSFFPEIKFEHIDPKMAKITIEDLLTMRSGFVVDWQIRSDSINWLRACFSRPMAFEPGQRFVYDSMNTYILSAIIQRITTKTLLDYLKEKLFNEMDILEAQWEMSPENISTGGWGLYMKPESMAKFGQLLLCKGMWNGKQLIPSDWVEKMMREHVKMPSGDNYCFHMWKCSSTGTVRADGAFGQYIYIIPDKEMVITLTQCTNGNSKNEEQLIWNVLMPGVYEKEIVENIMYSQLQERAWSYSQPLLEGERSNSIFNSYKDKKIKLKKNILGWDCFYLSSDSDETIKIVITDTLGRIGEIPLGYQRWKTSPVNIFPLNPRIKTKNRFSSFTYPFHTGGCYAWKDDELFIKIHFVDWVSSVLLRFCFEIDKVQIMAKTNYSENEVAMLDY